ncbi:uncharacterized protein O3Q21_010463 isoform 1-T2 [Podargus strigoides]
MGESRETSVSRRLCSASRLTMRSSQVSQLMNICKCKNIRRRNIQRASSLCLVCSGELPRPNPALLQSRAMRTPAQRGACSVQRTVGTPHPFLGWCCSSAAGAGAWLAPPRRRTWRCPAWLQVLDVLGGASRIPCCVGDAQPMLMLQDGGTQAPGG